MKSLFTFEMPFLEYLHISLEGNKSLECWANAVFIIKKLKHYLFCGFSSIYTTIKNWQIFFSVSHQRPDLAIQGP